MKKNYILIAFSLIAKGFLASGPKIDQKNIYSLLKSDFITIEKKYPVSKTSLLERKIDTLCSEKKWLSAAFMTIFLAARLRGQAAINVCLNAALENADFKDFYKNLNSQDDNILKKLLELENSGEAPSELFFKLVSAIACYYKKGRLLHPFYIDIDHYDYGESEPSETCSNDSVAEETINLQDAFEEEFDFDESGDSFILYESDYEKTGLIGAEEFKKLLSNPIALRAKASTECNKFLKQLVLFAADAKAINSSEENSISEIHSLEPKKFRKLPDFQKQRLFYARNIYKKAYGLIKKGFVKRASFSAFLITDEPIAMITEKDWINILKSAHVLVDRKLVNEDSVLNETHITSESLHKKAAVELLLVVEMIEKKAPLRKKQKIELTPANLKASSGFIKPRAKTHQAEFRVDAPLKFIFPKNT